MNSKITVFLLVIMILLSACSSVSKTDCLAIDWTQVGLEDGQRGIGALNEDSYQANCLQHDVDVNASAYKQGHEKGVALFCQAENAFELGKKGYQYSVDCPIDFSEEYKTGYQFFIANTNISQVEKALIDNSANISKLESGISRATLQLSGDDLSTSEENQIRQSIESMTGQIQGYEQNTERLEPALSQLRQQLENLKASHAR